MGFLKEDDVEDVGAVPTCSHCGSERVARDAWACWNPQSGLWELEATFDKCHCHRCDGETSFVWKRLEAMQRDVVRELNDRFRRQGLGNGSVVITHAIKMRGPDFLESAVHAVSSFDAFTKDNDPWGEHDFGAVEVAGERVFWKIDCYDPSLTAAPENPGNEALTHRVLSIMLASEY